MGSRCQFSSGLTRRVLGAIKWLMGTGALRRQPNSVGPVRAVVRTLSDAELVIAQGKENNERRDLSFIERALFAAHLEHRKFERPTSSSTGGRQAGTLAAYFRRNSRLA